MDRIGRLENKIRPLEFYFEHRVQRREGRIYMFDRVGDVPSSMEEPGSFSGIFEIVAADKVRVVGWKRRTNLRGERRLPPLAGPSAVLGCPIFLRHP